jgi:hypothetical protein
MAVNQYIAGAARTTLNTEPGIKVIDMDTTMYRVAPEQTPITQFFLSSKFRNDETFGNRSQFQWPESAFFPTTITLTGAVAGGGTSATFNISNDYLIPFDYVYSDTTGQYFIVTAASPGTATVRLIIGSSITAITNGSTLRIITQAQTDNFSSPNAKSSNPLIKSGYCQILLYSIQVTGRQQAAKNYTGPDFKRQIVERLEEMKRDIERMLIINGVATDDQANDITYSAGLKGAIQTNVINYDSAVSEASLDSFLSTVMQKGSNERLLVMGTNYMNDANKFLKNVWKYWTDSVIKLYGGISKKGNNPNVLTYMGVKGPVYAVWCPLMDDVGLSNAAFALDPKKVLLRYMAADEQGPRKFRKEINVQTPGAGNRKDQYLADMGLQVINENLHGLHIKTPGT